jgi:hypothetical protein
LLHFLIVDAYSFGEQNVTNRKNQWYFQVMLLISALPARWRAAISGFTDFNTLGHDHRLSA